MAAKREYQKADYVVNSYPTVSRRKLNILSKNEDGTYELGNDDGVLVVGKCSTDTKHPGYCIPD